MFSFNSPYGACPDCDGLGTKMEIDPNLVVPDKTKSLSEGAIVPLGEQPRGGWFSSVLKALAKMYRFDFVTPFKDLPEEAKKAILYGTGNIPISVNLRSDRLTGEYSAPFEGVIPNLRRRYNQTSSTGVRMWIEQFMSVRPCSSCGGTRLRKESLAIKINGLSISDISSFSIKKCYHFFENLKLTETQHQIAKQILKEIKERLRFLINVGVDYLTLDRSAQKQAIN